MFCRADYFDDHWEFCFKTAVTVIKLMFSSTGFEAAWLLEVMSRVVLPSISWVTCESHNRPVFTNSTLNVLLWLVHDEKGVNYLSDVHLHHPTVSFYSVVIWLHPVLQLDCRLAELSQKHGSHFPCCLWYVIIKTWIFLERSELFVLRDLS